MHKLLRIGFNVVGRWKIEDDKLLCHLDTHKATTKVLYAFVSNGAVKYIGKTRMAFARRMYGYQNPGPTQSTNIRIHAQIISLLKLDEPVDIFMLADTGLLKYGDFTLNMAAGLEDDLIAVMNPDWNMLGTKPQIAMDEETESIGPIEIENAKGTTIDVVLGHAYYNQGFFFNIRKKYSDLLGPDKATIEVQLGQQADAPIIKGYINRTANVNDTPRLMLGVEYRDWVQQHYKEGDVMQVSILTPTALLLHDSKR